LERNRRAGIPPGYTEVSYRQGAMRVSFKWRFAIGLVLAAICVLAVVGHRHNTIGLTDFTFGKQKISIPNKYIFEVFQNSRPDDKSIGITVPLQDLGHASEEGSRLRMGDNRRAAFIELGYPDEVMLQKYFQKPTPDGEAVGGYHGYNVTPFTTNTFVASAGDFPKYFICNPALNGHLLPRLCSVTIALGPAPMANGESGHMICVNILFDFLEINKLNKIAIEISKISSSWLK
jgi:hypothetical protein